MTKDEFQKLNRGDLIRHKKSPEILIVSGNYGDHVTATTTCDATNPDEWNIIRKANYEYIS